MTDRPRGFAKLVQETRCWWRTGEFASPESKESESASQPEKTTRSPFSRNGLVLVIIIAVMAIMFVRYDREIVCRMAPDSQMCGEMTARRAEKLLEQVNDLRR